MEVELFHLCALQDPTELQVDQLKQLLNDKDCPHLLTVNSEDVTPLELICRCNKSTKLKQSVEAVVRILGNKNEPFNEEHYLNGTWALDAVCQNYNQHDLLDIVRLLIERTKINFNRHDLRLQQICKDLLWKDDEGLYLRPVIVLYTLVCATVKRAFLLSDFKEENFNQPCFRISDIFKKYLNHHNVNNLFQKSQFFHHHQVAAESQSIEIEKEYPVDKYGNKIILNISRVMNRPKNYEEIIPNIKTTLDNLNEELQLKFDRLRDDFCNKNLQISDLFINLFTNKRWNIQPALNSPSLCKVIELLLAESGLDINAKDRDCRMNALHLLVCYYQGTEAIEVAKLLIEYGIDINAKCPEQRNALHCLLFNENGVSNEVGIAKLLIENGIDVNAAEDENGYNAFHSLCMSYAGPNFVELAKMVLDNGVDVNAIDHYGRNALHSLDEYYDIPQHDPQKLSKHRVEISILLLNKGVDIYAIDAFRRTALHCLPPSLRQKSKIQAAAQRKQNSRR